MIAHTLADVARAYLDAYRTKNRKQLECLLSDDFRFTSPEDDGIDRERYFTRCWPNAENMREVDVERVWVEGAAAFMTYKIVTKNGKTFRNTEYLRFEGMRISSIDVYFGPTLRPEVFLSLVRPTVMEQPASEN